MACYAFSERLKFAIFKINKTALNILNEQEQEPSENKEPVEIILLPSVFNWWVILLSYKNFLGIFLIASFMRHNQKCCFCAFFSYITPRYNLPQNLIYYVHRFPRQILGSPTIWEYRYKMLLKSIATWRGITLSCEDTQTEFLMFFYWVLLLLWRNQISY